MQLCNHKQQLPINSEGKRAELVATSSSLGIPATNLLYDQREQKQNTSDLWLPLVGAVLVLAVFGNKESSNVF